jgi:hypothetical protein
MGSLLDPVEGGHAACAGDLVVVGEVGVLLDPQRVLEHRHDRDLVAGQVAMFIAVVAGFAADDPARVIVGLDARGKDDGGGLLHGFPPYRLRTMVSWNSASPIRSTSPRFMVSTPAS